MSLEDGFSKYDEVYLTPPEPEASDPEPEAPVVVCQTCFREVRLVGGRMEPHPNILADDDCDGDEWMD